MPVQLQAQAGLQLQAVTQLAQAAHEAVQSVVQLQLQTQAHMQLHEAHEVHAHTLLQGPQAQLHIQTAVQEPQEPQAAQAVQAVQETQATQALQLQAQAPQLQKQLHCTAASSWPSLSKKSSPSAKAGVSTEARASSTISMVSPDGRSPEEKNPERTGSVYCLCTGTFSGTPQGAEALTGRGK
jgi:hypothetical protein